MAFPLILIVLGLIGIALFLLSLRVWRKAQEEKQRGAGFALTALILSSVDLCIIALGLAYAVLLTNR